MRPHSIKLVCLSRPRRRARRSRFKAKASRAYCARAVACDGATNGAVRRGARTGSCQVPSTEGAEGGKGDPREGSRVLAGPGLALASWDSGVQQTDSQVTAARRRQRRFPRRLLDLPWEDVLLPHVLTWVPLRQLLRLQRVSRAFRELVQLYLAGLRRFDAAQVSRGPQPRPARAPPRVAPPTPRLQPGPSRGRAGRRERELSPGRAGDRSPR